MSSRFMLCGLKEARERAGLTQRTAAQRCRTTFSRYADWEKGAQNPSAAKAEQIADELGCELDDLADGFGPETEALPGLPNTVAREEFEELRQQVERLAAGAHAPRPSLYHDASEIAERLGLVDSHGRPVAAGCLIKTPACSRPRKVAAIEIADHRGAPDTGLASVTCVMEDGDRVHAVDMRVKGEVLERAGR